MSGMQAHTPCPNDENKRHALRGWFAGVLGSAVLEQEQDALGDILQDLFGYYLVQAGAVTPVDLHKESRIRARVVLDDRLPPLMAGPQIQGRVEAAPIGSDSVAVVLLPHTLEFAADPHLILREVERMLLAESHEVIVAFNPWSFWGVWRLARRRGGRPPWYGRFLGLSRIKDWLGLLGFDIVEERPLIYRPPLRHERVMRRLRGEAHHRPSRAWLRWRRCIPTVPAAATPGPAGGASCCATKAPKKTCMAASPWPPTIAWNCWPP